MKKIKALFLTLALGFTFAAAATAVACNKNNGGSATSSSDWFAGQEESVVSLRFTTPFIDTYQYEVFPLECLVSGTTSTVTFESSDPTIASVDANGVVTTGESMGKAIVTASVDGVTARCEINVGETPYAPEIILNASRYTIEAGEALTFDVTTEWNKTVLAEDVTYSVALAENSQNAKASVNVDGNTVTVTSNDVETFDLVVSTTVRNQYTSKVVTVEVKESVLRIQAESMDFKPAFGKYTAEISTTAQVGDMTNTLALNFTAVKGGSVIDGVTIDWEVEGDAAKIEEGVLVGQKRGTVTVTGTVEHEGETATVVVDCEVIAPVVHLEETYTLEIENIQNTTMKINEKLIGKLQNAELNGKVVSSQVVPTAQLIKFLYDQKSIDEGKRNPYFPTSASQLGEQQLVINTDLVIYTMDVNIYTMIINDADELDKMRELASTCETELNERYQQIKSSEYYDGYFVLGNDISYNRSIKSMTDTGSVWWCQGTTYDLNRGFKGVFDGMGYNIDGMTVGESHPSADPKQSGGIFGYLPKQGVVKNVSFTNATLLANNGFICSVGDGTIENVSISYKKIGGDKETTGLNGSGIRTMGSFFALKAGTNAVVRNCLVDASAADITVETGMYNGVKQHPIRLAGVATNVENVIVLCPNQTLLNSSGADITRLTYNEVIAEEGLTEKFDPSIWTTVDGIPMFKKQAENLNRDAEIEFLNVRPTLVVGFEMLVLTNNPYVKIEVEEVSGVTFENMLLKATQEAYKQEVTLTATSLLNPAITATHTVTIDSFGDVVATPSHAEPIVIYNTDGILSVGDNSWKGVNNYVYLGDTVVGTCGVGEDLVVDWEALGWGKSEVTVVSETNDVRTHFVLDVVVDYVKADFATATKVKVFDSVFSDTRTSDGYTFTEVESDVSAPEGYSQVKRLDCKTAWGTALSRSFVQKDDLGAYSDIFFAVRIVNGRFIMQQVTVEAAAGNWVFFHYTQTSDGVWAAEVTIGGTSYGTQYDIEESGLTHMLYRDGWSNGYLWYNNNQGEDQTTKELPFTTSIYATEVYGVKKA